jgi:hypothetical protein
MKIAATTKNKPVTITNPGPLLKRVVARAESRCPGRIRKPGKGPEIEKILALAGVEGVLNREDRIQSLEEELSKARWELRAKDAKHQRELARLKGEAA